MSTVAARAVSIGHSASGSSSTAHAQCASDMVAADGLPKYCHLSHQRHCSSGHSSSGYCNPFGDAELLSEKCFAQLIMKVEECRDGISSNTCEYVGRYSWTTAICDLVVARGMFWTPIFTDTVPKVQCPFKAVSKTRAWKWLGARK